MLWTSVGFSPSDRFPFRLKLEKVDGFEKNHRKTALADTTLLQQGAV